MIGLDSPGAAPALFALNLSLLITSLVVRPSTSRPVFWLGILGTVPCLLLTTTGHPIADYFSGSIFFGSILVGSDYILLHMPQLEFRESDQKEPILKASVFQRLAWGFRLWSAQRCIGWSHEPKGVFRDAPPPSTTRLQFILSKLVKLVSYLLILDLGSIYNHANPSFQPNGPPIASRPFTFRCLDVLAVGIMLRTHISLSHAAFSIVSVASGWSEPQDWKPAFGLWSDAYTLRRFWGRSWHQMLRRMLSTHGKFLAQKLGAKPGTAMSSRIQLLVAFALSGLIHYAADCRLHGQWGWAHSDSPRFFLMQFVGIEAESLVIKLGKQFGLGEWRGWYYVGYTTTLLWLVFTWSRWADMLVAGDYINQGLNIPVSIVMGLWEGQWFL